MSYWPGPAWHLWFIQTWFYILTWRFYTPCRARAVPVVRRAVSVWKPGRGGVAYISTRERASSGASAHTPHVEENILYWDYARAPPPPPPPPLGYMTRMRSHALKKTTFAAIAVQDTTTTWPRCTVHYWTLCTLVRGGSGEQQLRQPRKRLLFPRNVYSSAAGGVGGWLQRLHSSGQDPSFNQIFVPGNLGVLLEQNGAEFQHGAIVEKEQEVLVQFYSVMQKIELIVMLFLCSWLESYSLIILVFHIDSTQDIWIYMSYIYIYIHAAEGQ